MSIFSWARSIPEGDRAEAQAEAQAQIREEGWDTNENGSPDHGDLTPNTEDTIGSSSDNMENTWGAINSIPSGIASITTTNVPDASYTYMHNSAGFLCIRCSESAAYIYHGNSICEHCFNEREGWDE